jgi:hypothetical protein
VDPNNQFVFDHVDNLGFLCTQGAGMWDWSLRGPDARRADQLDGGTHAFAFTGSTKVTLEEQFASTSRGRFRLHSGLSMQMRKQYVCPSVWSTQAEP